MSPGCLRERAVGTPEYETEVKVDGGKNKIPIMKETICLKKDRASMKGPLLERKLQ